MVVQLLAATLLLGDFEPKKLNLDYQPRTGLTASYDGVQVVRGSFFQYYEGNWAKGIYSSNWNDQTVRRGADGSIAVEFSSKDGLATGVLTYQRTSTGFAGEYSFSWRGASPVNVENTLGMVWAPLFEKGSVALDGKIARSPSVRIPAGGDPVPRLFGPEARTVTLAGSFLDLNVISSRHDTTAVDGRGYRQDWAERDELFWIGHDRVSVAPGETVVYGASFDIARRSKFSERRLELSPTRIGKAEVAPPKNLGIPIPPKERVLVPGDSLRLLPSRTGAIHVRGVGRFALPRGLRIKTNVRDIGLPAEGFSMKVSAAGGIEIIGQDRRGLAYGLDSIGSYAITTADGGWEIPAMTIRDHPSLKFRGVHLFVGPKSVSWHRDFAERVLRPMRFNHVVLQCEQTEWAAIPGTKTAITTSKAALRTIFETYRSKGIEPIPLIQSFGHMEWFFANGKNRALAFNAQVPYAIDPRKPEARTKIAEIWNEAVALLKPNYLHFGLDEVDMRGFPDDPKLVTELWRIQLPFLASIATKYRLPMMLWGDKALAPGEAPDAAHGDDKANAEARRAVIPTGSYITDWHYVDNPRPEVYKSLGLWNKLGYKAIASTWNRPGNIYGFTHAAIQTNSEGVLQTTWAGYEASEGAMLQSAPQFSSMIQTGFYAWSGDETLPSDLPFRADEVLQRWYFESERSQPSKISVYGDGDIVEIGPWTIPTKNALQFGSVMDASDAKNPTEVVWALSAPVQRVVLAVQTQASAKVGETVAMVTIGFTDGSSTLQPMQYAFDVRAGSDSRATWRSPSANSWSAISVPSGPVRSGQLIKSITIKVVNKASGLRIGGLLTVGS